MKKVLAVVLIAGLMSMLCGVAWAQDAPKTDAPKAEHKAKAAEKAKAGDAKTKESWDWGNKSGKAKAGEPKAQRTADAKSDREHSDGGGDKGMNKTDKQGDKTKGKSAPKKK